MMDCPIRLMWLFRQFEFNGITPSIVTLSILMNGYCNLRGMNFFFSILAKILMMGYEPNAITLTTFMKGMCLKRSSSRSIVLP